MNEDLKKVREWATWISRYRELQIEEVTSTKVLNWEHPLRGQGISRAAGVPKTEWGRVNTWGQRD